MTLQSAEVVSRLNSEQRDNNNNNNYYYYYYYYKQRDNYCQVHAILYPKSLNTSQYLNTKVSIVVVVVLVASSSSMVLKNVFNGITCDWRFFNQSDLL